MKESDIFTIEKKIGYTFKDKALLVRAFTHSSVSKDALGNYQSLEFLGDSILDFVVAKRLMEINPNAHEGALTKLRASIVSKEPLAAEVDRLGLSQYLIVGKGENLEVISSQEKIKSDIFEAIVAAIYLDSKRMECAEKFVTSKLANLFNGNCKHQDGADFKTQLNEYASRHGLDVEYVMVSSVGQPHCPTFTFKVLVNEQEYGVGEGKTKRDAEQICAKQAMEKLKAAPKH